MGLGQGQSDTFFSLSFSPHFPHQLHTVHGAGTLIHTFPEGLHFTLPKPSRTRPGALAGGNGGGGGGEIGTAVVVVLHFTPPPRSPGGMWK